MRIHVLLISLSILALVAPSLQARESNPDVEYVKSLWDKVDEVHPPPKPEGVQGPLFDWSLIEGIKPDINRIRAAAKFKSKSGLGNPSSWQMLSTLEPSQLPFLISLLNEKFVNTSQVCEGIGLAVRNPDDEKLVWPLMQNKEHFAYLVPAYNFTKNPEYLKYILDKKWVGADQISDSYIMNFITFRYRYGQKLSADEVEPFLKAYLARLYKTYAWYENNSHAKIAADLGFK